MKCSGCHINSENLIQWKCPALQYMVNSCKFATILSNKNFDRFIVLPDSPSVYPRWTLHTRYELLVTPYRTLFSPPGTLRLLASKNESKILQKMSDCVQNLRMPITCLKTCSLTQATAWRASSAATKCRLLHLPPTICQLESEFGQS